MRGAQENSSPGKGPAPAKALEIFCGSAGLSKALRAEGLMAEAVDWRGNRHNAAIAFHRIDLTEESGMAVLHDTLAQPDVRFVISLHRAGRSRGHAKGPCHRAV